MDGSKTRFLLGWPPGILAKVGRSQGAKRSVEPKGNASHKARTPGTKTDLRLQLVVFAWTFRVFRKIGGLGSIFYHPIGNI